MIALPSYIDPELWDAYCEMRRTMPKAIPFTDYARKLIVMELMKFHAEGYDANSSLQQAIMKGWRGVFKAELRSVTRKEVDPALQKISEDAKKAAPMPANLREQFAKITRREVV
jgi:Fe-S-cluster formation regulator IscX/YfhJ